MKSWLGFLQSQFKIWCPDVSPTFIDEETIVIAEIASGKTLPNSWLPERELLEILGCCLTVVEYEATLSQFQP